MAAINSFYIINKSGGLIFYKDYGSAGRMDTNDSLRLASLWHSMHAISQQLSPVSGCSGIELLQADTFDLNCFQSLTNEKGKFDELVEDKGVKILIDPKALMHVIGTEMDFVDDKLRSEFIFINPNSAGQCGCGESFMTMSSSEAAKRGGGPGT